jgi:hypothetical protein
VVDSFSYPPAHLISNKQRHEEDLTSHDQVWAEDALHWLAKALAAGVLPTPTPLPPPLVGGADGTADAWAWLRPALAPGQDPEPVAEEVAWARRAGVLLATAANGFDRLERADVMVLPPPAVVALLQVAENPCQRPELFPRFWPTLSNLCFVESGAAAGHRRQGAGPARRLRRGARRRQCAAAEPGRAVVAVVVLPLPLPLA